MGSATQALHDGVPLGVAFCQVGCDGLGKGFYSGKEGPEGGECIRGSEEVYQRIRVYQRKNGGAKELEVSLKGKKECGGLRRGVL